MANVLKNPQYPPEPKYGIGWTVKVNSPGWESPGLIMGISVGRDNRLWYDVETRPASGPLVYKRGRFNEKSLSPLNGRKRAGSLAWSEKLQRFAAPAATGWRILLDGKEELYTSKEAALAALVRAVIEEVSDGDNACNNS